MAQDDFHREVVAGDRVIFPRSERYGAGDSGMTYGDITDVRGNQIEIDGEMWIDASRVRKQ